MQVYSSAQGEVAEWLKAHAWKVCIRQRIEGSNPSLSAIRRRALCIFLYAIQSENNPFFSIVSKMPLDDTYELPCAVFNKYN